MDHLRRKQINGTKSVCQNKFWYDDIQEKTTLVPFNMNINNNVSTGTREVGVCVLVLNWTAQQCFDDDDGWDVSVKCHVEDNGE